MKNFMYPFFFLITAVVLFGCGLDWQPSWQAAKPSTPSDEAGRLLNAARIKYSEAADKESLLASIQAYRDVLAEDGGNYEALTLLANLYILLGTAYTEDEIEKSEYFRKAMLYAELAMYTNADFKKMVNTGVTPWDAAGTLTEKEVEAMFFWVTALQYEFKETMPMVAKIANVGWLGKCLVFLDRIEELAPDFGGGAVEFAKVICYYVLPASKGGSKERGDLYMRKAVEKGENRLLPRWARGKYYYQVTNEPEKARQDLQWIASRDITQFEDAYPWKVHFQEDARKLLASERQAATN